MAEKGERGQGPGFGEQLTEGMKRAAGAVRRAVRGPGEVQTSLLFQTLHAEHERVDLLLRQVLTERDQRRTLELWQELALDLTLHARAEQETVYDGLARIEQTSDLVREGLREHADIERQVMQINAMGPGHDEFRAKVRELQQAVRHHVDEEESQMLSRAYEVVDEVEERDLVEKFERRREQLEPRVAREFGISAPTGPQSRETRGREDQRSAGRRSEQKRASGGGRSKGKSAQRGRGGLEDHTVKELQELARKKGIEGRSKMKKQELIRALGKA